MKKPYVELKANVLLLQKVDVLTGSNEPLVPVARDHGLGGEVVSDNNWQILS